ncbi:cdc42 effector protein 3 [Erinaceus europaeus]|uniref:Cdc42 effector protein 3 n=1 Tax=Erinaceus europaeus TaxID=9365 RepID=A0A1S2ZL46_ERIEU|nr:cdc42 effector protein 3 [Erinaceus europaeus]XP_060042899.1 cdc42 effector protein 3 [Erinaceus europaeus]
MPAKTPIYLKGTATRKGRKPRLRDILSPDMISPPLGDFRHTVHIGKEGRHDTFGDMSFLQGNYELLPGLPPPPGPCDFLRAHSTSDAGPGDTPSPVLKNAISLPTIGGSQALMLPLLSRVTFSPKQEAPGLPAASCRGDTSWGSSGSASQSSHGRDSHSSSLSEPDPDWPAEDLCHLSRDQARSQESLSDLTGSLLSLQLDLGPSLLDEVLNVMDKNK